MFDTPGPRLFGTAPGVDFPRALVRGLRDRVQGPPDAMARVELYVNTTRMARRLREVFDAGPAALLPRVRLVTDLADPLSAAELPDPVPPLRRRLELTNLVSRLLDAQPDLAPRAALFDLADSLATLMEEMQGEDVPPEKIAALDVTDQSGHWQRSLQFLNIVQDYFGDDTAPDAQAFARLALRMRLAAWQADPPQHPVLVAGSTGSRGTTHELMCAVARLPQGAVLLPGFDFDQPRAVWDRLNEPLTGEDHPQFRFAKLMQALDLAPGDVLPWTGDAAPAPARNRTVSLALRPAPVTHQWLAEGPALPDLPGAMEGVTLTEAPSTRDEALAIALRLRQAVLDGQTAALITPDRMLTRQVTSALDRWDITPDDSAGTPAQLSPPGRLLRHVARLFEAPLTAEALLTLLKHPLVHRGAGRGPHLRNTRELELHIRRTGMPFPDPGALLDWGTEVAPWTAWVTGLCGQDRTGKRPLADWLADHIALAERLARGSDSEDASALWDENAGRTVRDAVEALRAEAHRAADLTARDYADLFDAVLSRAEVRDRDAAHPLVLIWGTLEARVMGADLLILAGLNEGSWPESPGADPWLNRQMRAQAGLLLPERRIGLSAHDFQQAVAAPEVWLTRSLKSDDAETVPSRWVNRLVNLMTGLPQRNGPQALAAMRARGAHWLALARAAEAPIAAAPAHRPSPAPPLEARPKKLSVTEIKRLIRDPYAVYARRTLGLKPMDPLMQAPDALLRGILLHDILETFLTAALEDPARLDAATLTQIARDKLAEVPFPTTRALWQARIARVAAWFVTTERARQDRATPSVANFEKTGEIVAQGVTLTGKADRIDIDDRGLAVIYDYKTGAAPSKSEQEHFDKQLLLEAAMVQRRAFPGLAPRDVAGAVFVSLKPGDPKEVPAPLDVAPPEKVWEEFIALLTAYADREKGYSARRALQKDNDVSDYDHLARFGEWDVTDLPETEVLE